MFRQPYNLMQAEKIYQKILSTKPEAGNNQPGLFTNGGTRWIKLPKGLDSTMLTAATMEVICTSRSRYIDYIDPNHVPQTL